MSTGDRSHTLPPTRSHTFASSAAWDRIEKILERFEDAWRHGARPRLEEYLEGSGRDRQALLIELIHEDLEYRLSARESVRVEDYLQRFAELRDQSTVVIDLLMAEYKHRRDRGEVCTVADYVQRFPELAEALSSGLRGLSPANISSPQATDPDATVSPSGEAQDSAVESTSAYDTDAASTKPMSNWPAIPGYEILGELGRGGMGVVYKARHLRLNRLVALKMLLARPHSHKAELRRFQSEAQAVAQLQDPNIVQVFEFGQHQGLPYFTMELVTGGTLANQLRGTPLPANEGAHLVEQVAHGVHHAHQQGIVHRDLKPGNILLTGDTRPARGADSRGSSSTLRLASIGIPKVSDFGLAKRVDVGSDLTKSGAVMGTPSYMAPEQASGDTKRVGPAADVYALGAILYECLTGRPPFKAATTVDTILQVRHAEPVPPSTLIPQTPRDLETICLKCLLKEPNKRYASALDLAEDLRRFLHYEPILARPTGRLERTLKWARRSPVRAALAGVSLLAGLFLLATFGILGQYQRQQADILRKELQQIETLAQLRVQIDEQQERARLSESEGRLDDARAELTGAHAILDAQPELDTGGLRDRLGQQQRQVEARLGNLKEARQARERLANFKRLRDEALFHETLFTGLDLAANRSKAREKAKAALSLYGVGIDDDLPDDEATLLDRDRKHLNEDDRHDLVNGCYELLLVWADTLATEAQAAQALKVLERADALGFAYGHQTQVYSIRKARYEAQVRGEVIVPQRIKPAGPAATAALDWFFAGLEDYRAGDFERAALACDVALSKQPRHFWARYVKALCHLRRGQWAEGKESLTICLERRADFVWARLLRGYASSERGNRDKKPADFAAARSDFDMALQGQRDPLVLYVGLVNRGVLAIHQQRWGDAVRDLREALPHRPDAYQASVNLAQALIGQKQEDEAIVVLDRAIQKTPKVALLYETRGRLHKKLKHADQARADFEKAIDLEPADTSPGLVSTRLDLGWLLERAGDHEAALAQYDAALEAQPRYALAHRLRAEALLASNRRDEAAAAFDRYLALDPQPAAKAYHVRGLLFAGAGRLAEAMEMYTLGLRLKPDDVEIRYDRGWVFLLMDAPRPALEDFNTCLYYDWGNANALAGRGNALVRLRRVDEALIAAAEAEQSDVPDARRLYNITCIFSLAVARLELENRNSPNPKTMHRSALLQEKALDYLQRTLEKTRPELRATFWRSQVKSDPALIALRRAPGYVRLDRQYGLQGS